MGSAGLLERERELAALKAHLALAQEGRGSIALVEGEAGLGKSRLLEAGRELARDHEIASRVARGSELEQDVPFGVARQLLDVPGPASTDPRVDWAVLEDGPLGDRGLALIQKLHQALLDVVWPADRTATVAPLLITVDDVQWVDEPSLAFLAHLAARVAELPVAMLLAVRTDELATAPDLIEALRAAPDAEVLRPRPLSEAGVAELARGELGGEVVDAFCRACAEASGGNPFYLRELLEALRAEDTLPSPERVREIAPDAVLRSIMVRLGRLGDEAAPLARAVAVLGEGANLRDAAALAEIEGSRAEAVADSLARARILAPGEPLRFTHPLIGSTLRADMGAFQLAAAHRRAAELLTRVGATPERVAPHLLIARPDGDPAVAETLRAAARSASERGDPAAAARFLRRALEEPPASEARPEVVLELARSETLAGSPRATESLDEAIAAVDDPSQRARVTASLATLVHMKGDFPTAVRLARQARSGLSADDALQPRLLATEIGAASLHPDLQADAEEALGPLVECARAGQAPPDPTLSATVAARVAQDGPPAVVRQLAQAAIAADPLIDEQPQGTSIGWLGSALFWVDELELGEGWLGAAVPAAQARGAVMAGATALLQRGQVHLHRGRLDEAVADADGALEIYRLGWTTSPWSTFVLVSAHTARGDLDAAAEAAELGARAGPERPEQGLLLVARAELNLARGDAEAALDDALAAGRHLDGRFGVNMPRIYDWRRFAALAAGRLGRFEEGLEHLTPALSRLREIGPARQLGAALTAAGLLERGETGLDLLAEAVALLESSPARLEYARTLLEQGAALRRAGRRTAAREPLYRALELADDFGAPPLVTAAREELSVLGLRPRRAARTGVAGLTPSELRIAGLAVRGLSTPQIAHELYVTPKTVETHLGHVYRKLSVAGRHELPAELGEAARTAS